METEDEREEFDRIKLYDSQNRYLEYFSLESVPENETVTDYCNRVTRQMEAFNTIDELLQYLDIVTYTTGTSWTDLLEDIYGLENYEYDSGTGKYALLSDDSEITEQTIMDNEFVNIIGEIFVLHCDYERGIKGKIKYFTKNMRPECDKRDCLGCAYLNHETGYCSADNEIKDCKYCKNAFTDKRLDDDNDLSYTSIGHFESGYGVFIRASAACNPPVAIIVQVHRKDLKRNVDVACYAPQFCPVCGRKIIENEPYLKDTNATRGKK